MLRKEPQWGKSFFISFPPIMFWLPSLIFWLPLTERGRVIKVSFLWLIVFSSFGGILLFLTGWNGGRIVYSILGGIRASAQIISYEVILSFFFLIRIGISRRFFLQDLKESRVFTRFFSCWWLLLPFWLVRIFSWNQSCPFCLNWGGIRIGERSEHGILLNFIYTSFFGGEYSIILAFRIISRTLFFQTWIWGLFFVIFILWVLRCFPRKRYDYFMYFKSILMFPSIIVMLVVEFLKIL